MRANCLRSGQENEAWPLNTVILAMTSRFLLSMLNFGNLFERFSLKMETFPYTFFPTQLRKLIYFCLCVSQLGTQHGGKIGTFFLWLTVGFFPVSIKHLHIYILQIPIREREKDGGKGKESYKYNQTEMGERPC